MKRPLVTALAIGAIGSAMAQPSVGLSIGIMIASATTEF